jgi:cytochrome c oxidase subunit 2
MYQDLAWWLTVVLVVAVLLLFVHVALSTRSREDYASISQRSGRIRTAAFFILILICAPVVGLSLTDLPYRALGDRSAAPQVVRVTGYQWRWDIRPAQVAAGVPVEFHVTSADVNHGFGIYDGALRLLAQTQAMPGYTNVLHHSFETPGTYRILCLEYCGLVHHGMMAELVVTAQQ